MRHATVPWVFGVACAIACLMSPLLASAEEEERDTRDVGHAAHTLLLTREILDHMDIEHTSRHEPGWVSTHLQLAGKGVKYSQPLSFGERRMVLNLSGPVMPRRTLGLSFEVKF